MALKITSATRVGGAGCQHYRLRVTDTTVGYDETIEVGLDDLDTLITEATTPATPAPKGQ